MSGSEQRTFVVRAVVEVEWLTIVAASADEAAAAVEDGTQGVSGPDEYTGWREITEVVSVERARDPRAEDERTRCACRHLWAEHRGAFSKPGRRRESGEKPKLHPQACDHRCGCVQPVAAEAVAS